VVVQSVTQAADGIVRLRLASPDGKPMPRWSPGSHIDVDCGDTGLSRQYSLCGDPAETGVLEIAVLREPESRGGSAWIHDHVKPGDRLKIRGPRNHFRMDEGCRKAIFIAGGIGITPVSAMARRALALGIDYEIHYSGRTRTGMAMIDELRALHGDRLRLYIKEEGGRNDLDALLARTDRSAQIYACGPARMVEALEQACTGWPDDALRVEHFATTLGTLDPSKEQPFEVELKDSGLTVTVPADQTLLTTLRCAGIDIQSDCEEGLCGSCEVRVLSGSVDHRDVVLTRGEREANTKMMTCCSRALQGSKLVLEL
jgi:ferredoxin-NADP reductase